MPDFTYELQYNPLCVAGVDEVGYGAWAGPVVAAAVFFASPCPEEILNKIDDSKRLNPPRRKELFDYFVSHPEMVKWSVGESSVEEIDALNILKASQLAMRRAVERLSLDCEGGLGHLLVDGLYTLDMPIQQTALVKGDSKSFSIAAASIMAKVIRDETMNVLHQQVPWFGWCTNKGYGTKHHGMALKEHGLSAFHRKSYRLQTYMQDSVY